MITQDENGTWNGRFISTVEDYSIEDEKIFHLPDQHPQSSHNPHYPRPLTKYEKRIDFAQAKKILNQDELSAAANLKRVLRQELSRVLAWFLAHGKQLTPQLVRQFNVSMGNPLRSALSDMYISTWRGGRDMGEKELPKGALILPDVKNIAAFSIPIWLENHELWNRLHTSLYLTQYAAAFKPKDALNAFETRAWMIESVIDTDLQAEVRYELFEHLKGGRTMDETMSNIKDIFEPWTGDTSAILPSGVSGTGEDILQAYRLENIVRTESTWAFNQGRIAIADAAGDYNLGFQFSAIIDTRTTPQCRAADGLVLQKDDPRTIKLTPPLYFNCRSLFTFVTQDDEPVEWSSDEEIDKAIALIPKGWK